MITFHLMPHRCVIVGMVVCVCGCVCASHTHAYTLSVCRPNEIDNKDGIKNQQNLTHTYEHIPQTELTPARANPQEHEQHNLSL